MAELDPAVEQQLADMYDDDWHALSARVRPPSSTAQLKAAAAQVLSGEQLDAFVAAANVSAFTDENGDVDEEKVAGHLTAIFGGTQENHSGAQNFGQYSGGPRPGSAPGDGGRAEAQRRFGGTDNTPPATPASRGAGGRAEAERRFGKRGQ